MTRGLGVLLGLCACASASAQPPASDLDRIAVEVLKDVHNRGAELYNTGQPAECLRMYQGALITVKPFLAHRPAVQKTIADGLDEVAKMTDGVKLQAFRLHEVIEKVRADLKEEAKKSEPAPSPPGPAPKPKEPAPKPKEPAPKPKEPVMKAATGGVLAGKVTLDGKPLADADVMLVSLKLPAPRVFVGTTTAGGDYKIAGPMPAGEYAVKVTAKVKVAAKFEDFLTSGVRANVADGANTLDLALMSK